MQQTSNTYSKYTGVAFVIFITVALVNFFFPSKGNVNWMDYKEALEKAISVSKPLLIFPMQKYSGRTKLAENSIFSNDSVVSFIQSEFIATSLDLDKANEKTIANTKYKTNNPNFSIVADKFGRGVAYLDNSWSSSVFMEFARRILNFKTMMFLNFDDAKYQSQLQSKPTLIFVSNSFTQNIDINEHLKDEDLFKAIDTYFIPTLVMMYEEWDKTLVKDVIPIDNTEQISIGVSSQNGFKFTKSAEARIIITSDKDSVLKTFIIGNDTEEIKSAIKEFTKK
ncbi:MAG: hypothetical protein WC313_03380 [Candidatus Kapaibacterium sp.]|jgi:hypothetical protein|nr:hypothetical protein [Candidatus Kapabacteria bacterium]